MTSAFVGVIDWWILNGMPQSPEYFAEQLWGLLKRNQVTNDNLKNKTYSVVQFLVYPLYD